MTSAQGEEDGGREDDGVAAADPVGGAAGGDGPDEGVKVDDAGQDLGLRVTDLEVVLDEERCPAHRCNICRQCNIT